MTPEQKKATQEFAFWFGLGLAAFALTFTFNEKIDLYAYGANVWPAGLGLCMMSCAALLWSCRMLFPHATQQENPAPKDSSGSFFRRWPVFVLPVIYVASLPYAGFYAATLIFLPLYVRCVGEKSLLRTLTICIPIVGLISVVFTKYLFVPFPVGIWPLFYEFNSMLVELMY